MRVDFYLLDADPVETVAPLLARKTLEAGKRLSIAAQDSDLRAKLDRALWEREGDAFLAHGGASDSNAARQPILLGETTTSANDATFAMLADGIWREEARGFERVMLLFGEDRRQAARELWKAFSAEEGLEKNFLKQEGGRWQRLG
ncbi:DNA polymerase III subunit chi [Qipengyuania sp. DSG2-2]|uniref:DNA polymerase III subunit chi n=1 Tax=Qipengyuania sp. DGS2-2 TaxID=3349631 RepID=UPI0036D3B9C6